MSDAAQSAAQPQALDPLSESLGRSFWQVGAITFWTQLFIAILPVAVISGIFASIPNAQSPGSSLNLLGYMSALGFAILLFTTFWAWRHMKRGRRLEEGGERADPPKLVRAVWVGLVASSVGILFSLVVLTAEVVYLLVRFLEAPQAGAMVVQTAEAGATWISALDMLGLMTLALTVGAEIIVLVSGLWLLYRVTSRAARAD